MKKEKLIFYLMLLGIVLGIPSIIYLIENNGDITGYIGEYSYIIGNSNEILTRIGSVIYAWNIMLIFAIYIKLIKKSEQFKGIKSIVLTAAILGMMYLVALPNTSKDVFFYMGNGRVIDKYGENPYLVSVRESTGIECYRSYYRNSW